MPTKFWCSCLLESENLEGRANERKALRSVLEKVCMDESLLKLS
jgi:hypothetical protein